MRAGDTSSPSAGRRESVAAQRLTNCIRAGRILTLVVIFVWVTGFVAFKRSVRLRRRVRDLLLSGADPSHPELAHLGGTPPPLWHGLHGVRRRVEYARKGPCPRRRPMPTKTGLRVVRVMRPPGAMHTTIHVQCLIATVFRQPRQRSPPFWRPSTLR